MADRRRADEDAAENDEEPPAERKQWRVRLRAGECTVTLEEDVHFILVKPIPMETRPARDEEGRAEVGVDDEDDPRADAAVGGVAAALLAQKKKTRSRSAPDSLTE